MNTPQAQIKINLPLNLKEFIESKASRFGMPVAGYIKHLILKEVEDMDYPVYEPSAKAERSYKQALKDQKEGKLIEVKDIDKFFDEL